ncbi:hypothetical protein TanjilG_07409 [Lupinus angustifolius]|uniref:AMP-activated protein kinase glycogen-binding domain-containing protein n=1 Tax=Lupinus angustifolius TaxID=3871 RepID=A0A394D9S4_LUPAN|nr:hypothetical protein TanjilG_07409 [Lupinus angustifolius]
MSTIPSSISITLISRKLSVTNFFQPTAISLTRFHLRAALTNNATTRTRRSRRLKSDAEICNDIHQFLIDVGLPENHIPSTKELLNYGRKDLANIVRRRGHKQIEELLTSSLNASIHYLNTENSLDKRMVLSQNVKMDSLVDDVTTSTKILLGDNSSSLDTDSTQSLDECTSIPVDSSANSSMDNGLGELKDLAEEVNKVPIELTFTDDYSSSREIHYPNFDNQSFIPIEISGESSFETNSCGDFESEDTMGKLVRGTALPLTVSSVENHSNTSFNDSDLDTKDEMFSHLESSMELSLEQKVANFIQNGDLDPVEDHVSGISNGNDSQERKVYTEPEPVVDIPLNTHPPEENNNMELNVSSLTSKEVISSGMWEQVLVDDHMQHEDLTVHNHKNFNDEAPKVQNQSEINQLKFMLVVVVKHQKELELSRLKEQIEKKKFALSVLQTKTEEEISKARKYVSEKDTELQIAEESLSGLKEVQIEFCGEGDVVEVAGSFNGWHHRIKMDPQQSISVVELGESRRSKFWSTMLWLYPGVYEVGASSSNAYATDPCICTT